MYKDPKVIGCITMKNGFTLSEVRKIRKEIRALSRRNDVSFEWDSTNIFGAFTWHYTPQGGGYWDRIYMRSEGIERERS